MVGVTDASGNLVVKYGYDPYGTVTCSAGTGSCNLYEPIRFAGGYLDTHQDGKGPMLLKFGERYYDPTLGRWTQDPISQPLDQHGWNRYVYSGDDPINNVDPSGMCFLDLCQAVHAALSVVALPVYAVYYASYQADGALPGAFAPTEATGLGADAAIDWIKGHTVNHASICDEGIRGHILPFHRGPATYLPGVHRGTCHVDFR